jgi:hypothetical protein
MSENRLSLKDLLFLPLGFFISMPPLVMGITMILLLSICGFLYYTLNSDFFGLAAPPFAELNFSKDFTRVSDTKDHRSWKISYENIPFSTFKGVVRHVSNWRDEPIPFATHDILVTTGEFSSASRVRTQVRNHTFYYQWDTAPDPQGTINLLHIIPQTEQIYRQLLEVSEWNLVTISGREIYRIDLFDDKGNFTSYWQDHGCNSILVTSVKIEMQGTPIP